MIHDAQETQNFVPVTGQHEDKDRDVQGRGLHFF